MTDRQSALCETAWENLSENLLKRDLGGRKMNVHIDQASVLRGVCREHQRSVAAQIDAFLYQWIESWDEFAACAEYEERTGDRTKLEANMNARYEIIQQVLRLPIDGEAACNSKARFVSHICVDLNSDYSDEECDVFKIWEQIRDWNLAQKRQGSCVEPDRSQTSVMSPMLESIDELDMALENWACALRALDYWLEEIEPRIGAEATMLHWLHRTMHETHQRAGKATLGIAEARWV